MSQRLKLHAPVCRRSSLLLSELMGGGNLSCRLRAPRGKFRKLWIIQSGKQAGTMMRSTRASSSSQKGYEIDQLRYELCKRKAHGTLQRNGRCYAYRLTDKEPKNSKWHDCFCSSISGYVGHSPTACSAATAAPNTCRQLSGIRLPHGRRSYPADHPAGAGSMD